MKNNYFERMMAIKKLNTENTKRCEMLTQEGKFAIAVIIVFAVVFAIIGFVNSFFKQSDITVVTLPHYGKPIERIETNIPTLVPITKGKEFLSKEFVSEYLYTKNHCEQEMKATEFSTEPINREDMDTVLHTEDDLYYLAAAVCREAGGESEEIQLLVANVIMNRVNSSLYPNTIYEVLTQRMQYGMMWKYGVSFPSWATPEVKEQCYSVAKRLLSGERFCPENVLYQAEFQQGSGVYKYYEEGYYFCYY